MDDRLVIFFLHIIGLLITSEVIACKIESLTINADGDCTIERTLVLLVLGISYYLIFT